MKKWGILKDCGGGEGCNKHAPSKQSTTKSEIGSCIIMAHSDQSFQGIPALPCNITGTGPENKTNKVKTLDFAVMGNWVTLYLMYLRF